MDLTNKQEELEQEFLALGYSAQRRVLCMLELSFDQQKYAYDTDFGTYYCERRDTDVNFNFKGRRVYFHYILYLSDAFLTLTFVKNYKNPWQPIRKKLCAQIGYSEEDFTCDYEAFKVGRLLKNQRSVNKKDFAVKSGLSKRVISQIEEECYNAKIKDVVTYCEKGLGKKLSIGIS